jgi:hypothetical protein
MEDVNIIRNNNGSIKYISFNLLLQKISHGEFKDELKNIISQLNCFISTEMFLDKIEIFIKDKTGL